MRLFCNFGFVHTGFCMITKKITSLQHPLVKHWFELRTSRSYREEHQRVLISGKKMASELPIDVLITSNDPTGFQGRQIYQVTEPILKKITGLQQPDGFAAEISLPQPQDLSDKNFLLILDQITDPGNLGTLLRTALALKWEGVLVTPGTVDLFNDKALRAAKGAHFHLPYARASKEEILSFNHQLYTADLKGKPLDSARFAPPLALILSSEAHGAASWAKTRGETLTIPMSPKVESLNVSTSGAILLYAMRPQ